MEKILLQVEDKDFDLEREGQRQMEGRWTTYEAYEDVPIESQHDCFRLRRAKRLTDLA